MDYDMYSFSFYLVFIGTLKQLGVFNDFFLVVNKEINMIRTVMHHIRFDFFCQFLKLLLAFWVSYCFWYILSR